MIFFLLYSKVFVDIIFFNFLLLIIKIDFDQSDNLYIYLVFLFFQMNFFDIIDFDDILFYYNDGYIEIYGYVWINGDFDGNCFDLDFFGIFLEMLSLFS